MVIHPTVATRASRESPSQPKPAVALGPFLCGRHACRRSRTSTHPVAIVAIVAACIWRTCRLSQRALAIALAAAPLRGVLTAALTIEVRSLLIRLE